MRGRPPSFARIRRRHSFVLPKRPLAALPFPPSSGPATNGIRVPSRPGLAAVMSDGVMRRSVGRAGAGAAAQATLTLCEPPRPPSRALSQLKRGHQGELSVWRRHARPGHGESPAGPLVTEKRKKGPRTGAGYRSAARRLRRLAWAGSPSRNPMASMSRPGCGRSVALASPDQSGEAVGP